MVKKNQHVKTGEILLILEAMKMKNRVIMPFDDIVKFINVKKGEIVPKKHIMIEVAAG